MTSPKSATPVRVPKSASAYTAATEDPSLRSQINTVLWRDGHVTKIHDALLHALHSSPSNWPSLVQAHALSILRSGECHTFPDLMSQVLDDIRKDTAAANSPAKMEPKGKTDTKGRSDARGKNESKGKHDTKGKGKAKVEDVGTGSGEGGASLAMPKHVVEEGFRTTRECLECVCEVER